MTQDTDVPRPETPEDADGLVRAYADAVYRFARVRCGDDAELARDVVQETFLGAIAGYRKFRGEAALFTWLCGIARRQAALALRKRRRDASLLERLDAMDARLRQVVERLESAPLEPSDLEHKELRGAVQAVVTALPPRYREALESKYVREEPTASLAARFGLSVKGAESLLTRAREAFREGLRALAGAGPGAGHTSAYGANA